MQKTIWLFLITAIITLNGCGSFRFPGVFKIDIAQGNIVTKEMLEKLKPGMTKSQVRYVMGSPLVTDPFHPNRWDYFYSIRLGDNDPIERHVSLYFDEDQFTHFSGDFVTEEEMDKYKAYQPEDRSLENDRHEAQKSVL